MSHKFKRGDIIKGNSSCPYESRHKNYPAKVISLHGWGDADLRVEYLKGPLKGVGVNIESKYFDLVRTNQRTLSKKKKDYIIIIDEKIIKRKMK